MKESSHLVTTAGANPVVTQTALIKLNQNLRMWERDKLGKRDEGEKETGEGRRKE